MTEIDRLLAVIEDAIDTLESMGLHIDNPLYERLREALCIRQLFEQSPAADMTPEKSRRYEPLDDIGTILHQGRWRIFSTSHQQAEEFLAQLMERGYGIVPLPEHVKK